MLQILSLQAGTQFWDAKMDKELTEGRLEGTSFDRSAPVDSVLLFLSLVQCPALHTDSVN